MRQAIKTRTLNKIDWLLCATCFKSLTENTLPAMQLAAWQGAWRLFGAQLHGVHPRQPKGLRPLGEERQLRLGLPRRVALLQEVGRPAESLFGAK